MYLSLSQHCTLVLLFWLRTSKVIMLNKLNYFYKCNLLRYFTLKILWNSVLECLSQCSYFVSHFRIYCWKCWFVHNFSSVCHCLYNFIIYCYFSLCNIYKWSCWRRRSILYPLFIFLLYISYKQQSEVQFSSKYLILIC